MGQKRDHSAVAVVERVEAYSAYRAPALGRLEVKYLERVPLGDVVSGGGGAGEEDCAVRGD